MDTEAKATTEMELLQRITSMERKVTQLQSDTAEIVAWIKHIRVGSQVTGKFLHGVGSVSLWIAKVLGTAAMVYGAWMAIRSGKFPSWFPF